MVAGLGVLHCRSYISKHMADFASGVALVSASEGVASSSVTLVSATTLIIYLLVILIYPITDFDLHSTNPANVCKTLLANDFLCVYNKVTPCMSNQTLMTCKSTTHLGE